MIDGEDEFFVEAIVNERLHRRKKQYLVKWIGYQELTWEPEENVADTEALQLWEDRHTPKEGALPKEGGTVRG